MLFPLFASINLYIVFISLGCPQQRLVWSVGLCHSDSGMACQTITVLALSWSWSPQSLQRPTRLSSLPAWKVSSCSCSLFLFEPCLHLPLPSPPWKGVQFKLQWPLPSAKIKSTEGWCLLQCGALQFVNFNRETHLSVPVRTSLLGLVEWKRWLGVGSPSSRPMPYQAVSEMTTRTC